MLLPAAAAVCALAASQCCPLEGAAARGGGPHTETPLKATKATKTMLLPAAATAGLRRSRRGQGGAGGGDGGGGGAVVAMEAVKATAKATETELSFRRGRRWQRQPQQLERGTETAAVV
ncbi:hypothetical protein T492DRAFT_908023 [Pavlovales sp. CCMP2436]|nr:hypothetical protein T492DRAFT_908023 [Pavlovales sp. CCMP2436]